LYSDAGTVSTQAPKSDLNVLVASKVASSKRFPGSCIDEATSELSSEDDSKPPTKAPDSKRPAPKTPTKLDRDQLETHSAKVGKRAEKKYVEESSSDNFHNDTNDPDFVDDENTVRSGKKIIHNSSSTDELQEVPEDPNVVNSRQNRGVTIGYTGSLLCTT
jgi:hypothetical protein